MIGILGAVLIFGLIVFIHELGHFTAAKLSGMTVYDFALGFGPALVKVKRGDTTYAIRAVPLGGYVRIAGMEPPEGDEAAESPEEPGSYENKPYFAKFITMFAGVGMNLLLGLVLVIILGMAIGEPTPGNKVYVGGVQPGAPAERAGLQPGDLLISMGGEPIGPDTKIRDVLNGKPAPVPVVVERNGKSITAMVTPEDVKTVERRGYFYYGTTYRGMGVALMPSDGGWRRKGFREATVDGAAGVLGIIDDSLAQFLSVITGKIPVSMMGGPAAIARVSIGATESAFISRAGVANLLGFVALISVAIGFFNLLPIPPLDGSRLVILTAERIRGKRFDRKKEAMVHMVGMAILLLFMLAITFKDIWQWVTQR